MPDSHKTFGQHMQQKAAYKLDGIYGCLLCLCYVSVFKGQDAIVGNGNPVGIARQIFEHILRLFNGVSDTALNKIRIITFTYDPYRYLWNQHGTRIKTWRYGHD